PAVTHSTLFPYTTLFRSSFEQRGSTKTAVFHRAESNLSDIRLPLWTYGRLYTSRGTFGITGRGDPIVTAYIGDNFTILDTKAILDRKSTRLNSSHQIISY